MGDPLSTRLMRSLKMRRMAAFMTQAELAEAMARRGLPWTRVAVAEMERGYRRIEYDALEPLAELWGVSVAALLGLRDDPPRPPAEFAVCPECGAELVVRVQLKSTKPTPAVIIPRR